MTNFEKYFNGDWFEVTNLIWNACNAECSNCLFYEDCTELKIPCPVDEDSYEKFKNWLGKDIFDFKPCPFCGGTEIAFIDPDGDDVEDTYTQVAVCCSKHDGGCGASSGFFTTKEKAVKEWNRRV